MAKSAKKYSNPKSVVKSGFRRVTKSELKALGYSVRSALYTKAGVSKPTKFLTRSDIRKVQQPIREAALFKNFRFSKLKHEKILATGETKTGKRKKLFRHTYAVYSDFQKPVTLDVAIALTQQFFNFLQSKHHPKPTTEIGMIYKGVNDDFSLMPKLWKYRQTHIIDRLRGSIKQSLPQNVLFIMILGWIEQGT